MWTSHERLAVASVGNGAYAYCKIGLALAYLYAYAVQERATLILDDFRPIGNFVLGCEQAEEFQYLAHANPEHLRLAISR